MASFTSAGSTLGVSATLPTTFDNNVTTGYASLTFTTIGEITDLGEFGRQYNRVDHLPLASRQIVKRKGSYDNGTMTVVCALDEDDAGQVIMKAAAGSDNSYAFRVTLQNGDIYWFTGQVMSDNINVGGTDNITQITYQIEIDRAIVYEAI